MKLISMPLNYLQEKPVIGVVTALYSYTIASINPSEVLIQISAYGGGVVVILTIVSQALNIFYKIKNKGEK